MTMSRLNFPFVKSALAASAIFVSASLFAAESPVTISENDASFTLDNGIVAARVSKRSGDITSLKYKNLELLENNSGRAFGYWSHDASSTNGHMTRITIDPKANGGARGEVSVKGIAGGNRMGSGPGGSVIADIEIRYALGRGDSGVYTYSIFSHPTNYPGTSLGEARFCAKLNDSIFDWMTVDANRNMKLISAYDWNHGTVMNGKEMRRMNTGIYKGEVEHKYDYSANQFETLAWGWSSTTKNVGLWFVNPTIEYLSGGPTKVELSAHRDATFNTNALGAPAPPCLLNYWRGSHYGGSVCSVTNGEEWTKVIGPFLIYCNAGKSPDEMWKDALSRSTKETKAWPYDWVAGVDYPHKNERATVKGQLVLNDPQAPKAKMSNLLVGLSAPDYTPPRINRGGFGGGGFGGGGGFSMAGGGEDEAATTNANLTFGGVPGAGNAGTNFNNGGGGRRGFAGNFADGTNSVAGTNGFGGGRFGRRGGRGGGGGGGFGGQPRVVDWQNDAKHYEFWVRGDAKGNFKIPNVRPGNYTLHAIADGVFGEFALTNVTVEAGKSLNLAKLNWQPVRLGKQLWDVGIPNRKGSEFFKGDDYFHWGWYLEYAKLFPNDVNYVIGRSDFRKDWFFEQVPHNENPENTTGSGRGRSTTWSITFYLSDAPRGKAILRMAICGSATRNLTVTMNDKSAGTIAVPPYNATINRDGIGGYWSPRDLAFDASLMKAGENVMKLTIPEGSLTSGVIYDYLRLELDESAEPPPKPIANAESPPGAARN
jgi:rhamnogalacturonan endolyase